MVWILVAVFYILFWLAAHAPFRWRTFFDDGEVAANPSANALNTAENADQGKFLQRVFLDDDNRPLPSAGPSHLHFDIFDWLASTFFLPLSVCLCVPF